MAVKACITQHSCPQLAGESEATILFDATLTGIPVIVEGNFACAGYPPLSVERVEIIGSKARATLDNDVLRLYGAHPEEHRFSSLEAIQQSFNLSMAHFIERLRTGEPFLNEAADNIATLEAVDAAYAAAN